MKNASRSPSSSGRVSALLATLCLLAVFLAGLWLGVGIARTTATSPAFLTSTILESHVLYQKGLDALILDISNSDFVERLNEGPLHVGQDEVTRILYATYDTTDTSAKAREVHADLLSFVRAFPREEIFRISIAVERRAMADSLGRVLLEQYAALPECGVGGDLSSLVSAARVRFFGGSGEEFFNQRHPDCRPPDMVADKVQEGLREEILDMAESGPDSVEAFPENEGDEAFAELMVQVNRRLLWTHPAWPTLLLLVATGGYAAVRGPRAFAPPVAALGAGILTYGDLAFMVAPDQIQQRFAGAGTEGEASEIWAELGAYLLQRTATFSGVVAALLGATVLVLLAVSRFVSRQPNRKTRS